MENSKKTVKGQDGSAKTELSFLFLMFMLLAIGFAFALTNTQYSVMMYLFTRTGLTASVLPGWDNLSSRCTP